jgi:5-oxoprolinase (ATP-hydrolysing) subunit A
MGQLAAGLGHLVALNNKLIDLNADVGERPGTEGVAADAAIIAAVTSANVACGFHAGDAETMRAVCDIAVLKRKRIGAHVSFLDQEGFGRREMDVEPRVLRDQVVQQIKALQIIAGAAGGAVGYVKPHGALYNQAAVDPGYATALAEAIVSVDGALKLLGPPDSKLLAAAAAHGLEGVAEGFPDRAYAADGTLVPRSEPGAILDHDASVAQARHLAEEGRCRSLCIHSDTPGAADLAIAIRNHLIGAGFEIRPFA